MTHDNIDRRGAEKKEDMQRDNVARKGLDSSRPQRRVVDGHTKPCEECGVLDWRTDNSRGEVSCGGCGLAGADCFLVVLRGLAERLPMRSTIPPSKFDTYISLNGGSQRNSCNCLMVFRFFPRIKVPPVKEAVPLGVRITPLGPGGKGPGDGAGEG